MCGRFSANYTLDELREYYSLSGALFNLQPRFNVYPSEDAYVVINTDEGAQARTARWGLTPHWAKDEKFGWKTFNARAETAAEKPTFRNALKTRRCVVPVDSFYEWTGAKGVKQPYRILPQEGGIMNFAGLWEDNDTYGTTFTILTCAANDQMENLHHRMPVILARDSVETWLRTPSPSILAPYSGKLRIYPVSADALKPGNDNSACHEEFMGSLFPEIGGN